MNPHWLSSSSASNCFQFSPAFSSSSSSSSTSSLISPAQWSTAPSNFHCAPFASSSTTQTTQQHLQPTNIASNFVASHNASPLDFPTSASFSVSAVHSSTSSSNCVPHSHSATHSASNADSIAPPRLILRVRAKDSKRKLADRTEQNKKSSSKQAGKEEAKASDDHDENDSLKKRSRVESSTLTQSSISASSSASTSASASGTNSSELFSLSTLYSRVASWLSQYSIPSDRADGETPTFDIELDHKTVKKLKAALKQQTHTVNAPIVSRQSNTDAIQSSPSASSDHSVLLSASASSISLHLPSSGGPDSGSGNSGYADVSTASTFNLYRARHVNLYSSTRRRLRAAARAQRRNADKPPATAAAATSTSSTSLPPKSRVHHTASMGVHALLPQNTVLIRTAAPDTVEERRIQKQKDFDCRLPSNPSLSAASVASFPLPESERKASVRRKLQPNFRKREVPREKTVGCGVGSGLMSDAMKELMLDYFQLHGKEDETKDNNSRGPSSLQPSISTKTAFQKDQRETFSSQTMLCEQPPAPSSVTMLHAVLNFDDDDKDDGTNPEKYEGASSESDDGFDVDETENDPEDENAENAAANDYPDESSHDENTDQDREEEQQEEDDDDNDDTILVQKQLQANQKHIGMFARKAPAWLPRGRDCDDDDDDDIHDEKTFKKKRSPKPKHRGSGSEDYDVDDYVNGADDDYDYSNILADFDQSDPFAKAFRSYLAKNSEHHQHQQSGMNNHEDDSGADEEEEDGAASIGGTDMIAEAEIDAIGEGIQRSVALKP